LNKIGNEQLIGGDMDEVRKEREAIRAKIKPLEDEKIPIDASIKFLEEQLNDINERNNKAYNSTLELNSGKESLVSCSSYSTFCVFIYS
jgi:predicted  nucleic acid-binding Zn-ribbon protein